MEEKSIVCVIYNLEEDPSWYDCWIIPSNLYKKYLRNERQIQINDDHLLHGVTAGANRRYADGVGIVIKSFLEGQDYSLVLFGDAKIIIPNDRLYLQEKP